MTKETIKEAFKKTLPVMAGYLVLGFGFGIISAENGYGFMWALAMSAFIYAGSMQYVAVSLLTSGASLISAALTTLMVNARHLFYGISMIKLYEKAGKYKPYLIFGLTDETYSLVCMGEAPKGINFHAYAFSISLLNQCYWILGSVLGALAGSLTEWNTTGVDFAMTALFITVFVEQWKSTKNHIPALLGIFLSLICLIIFGADRFLIPSMLFISAALILGRNMITKEEKVQNESYT